MALGDVTTEIVPGGGVQLASAAALVRTIVQLGVATGGTPNQVYRVGDLATLATTLGSGPLVEAVALRHRSGLSSYAVPITPSQAGVLSAVTHAGTGSGTIVASTAPYRLVEVRIDTAGALGTMAFRWRLGGSGVWSDLQPSSSSAPFVFRVPGTFCRVSFAAGTYVAASTYVLGTDGTITIGGGGIATVTQSSDPVDAYELLATVVKDGSLGAAQLRLSLDGGKTTLPDLLIPSNGKVVVAGTGLVLTCSSTFVAGESYSLLTAPPGYSTSDLSAALQGLISDRAVQASLVHIIGLPSTAAGAMSAASTLQVQLDVALGDGIDWQGLCECPVLGDVVVSGNSAVRDTADTDAVIRLAREPLDLLRVALCAGTHRVVSPLTSRQARRPFGWALAARYVDTLPREDLSATEPRGPLGIVEIGRDEAATLGLDEVQINTARTYRPPRRGVYMSITRGGFGWKNLTTQADFQDAGGVRVLNVGMAALRVAGQALLAQRPPTKPDGTIEEKQARAWDLFLESTLQRALGLPGGGQAGRELAGEFAEPQASAATARILRSSQLGTSPRRLDIEYRIQPLGFISEVYSLVRFSGVLTVEN